MIATVFDYGAGNLHSLAKALATGGVEVHIETDPVRAADAELLVLPGVGAFAPAAARLAPGLPALRAALAGGLPCIGICLGMQLLFDRSEEGAGAGLGVFRGPVTRLAARRLPHIGWNAIEDAHGAVQERLATAYFANSYACRPADLGCVTAWSTHEGDRFASIVQRGRVMGAQFHPEKSSRAGLRFLAECVHQVTR